jgi:hypothetical protein
MTVWNCYLSLAQRQIDQPEKLLGVSRGGGCPWDNNGFSFHSSSETSFSPLPQCLNLTKQAKRAIMYIQKSVFQTAECGLYEPEQYLPPEFVQWSTILDVFDQAILTKEHH